VTKESGNLVTFRAKLTGSDQCFRYADVGVTTKRFLSSFVSMIRTRHHQPFFAERSSGRRDGRSLGTVDVYG
jgi:hypothetical protein